MHWRRKWQPTPVFMPGESQGRGSLVGHHLWGRRVGHDSSDLAAAAAAIKPFTFSHAVNIVCYSNFCSKVTFLLELLKLKYFIFINFISEVHHLFMENHVLIKLCSCD